MYKDNPQEGEKFVNDSLGRINTATDAAEASKSADLVVEAIVENIEVKHKLFKQLDGVCIVLFDIYFVDFTPLCMFIFE